MPRAASGLWSVVMELVATGAGSGSGARYAGPTDEDDDGEDAALLLVLVAAVVETLDPAFLPFCFAFALVLAQHRNIVRRLAFASVLGTLETLF